jgi:hypothetical protein
MDGAVTNSSTHSHGEKDLHAFQRIISLVWRERRCLAVRAAYDLTVSPTRGLAGKFRNDNSRRDELC